MAELVVDLLEVVEVDEQHHDGVDLVAGDAQGMIHAVEEQGPVREPGELVVERTMRQLAFQVALFGDVAKRGDDPVHRGSADEVRDDDDGLAELSVEMRQRDLELDGAARAVLDHAFELSSRQLAFVGDDDVDQVTAGPALGVMAEHRPQPGTRVVHPTVHVGEHHDIARVLDHRSQAVATALFAQVADLVHEAPHAGEGEHDHCNGGDGDHDRRRARSQPGRHHEQQRTQWYERRDEESEHLDPVHRGGVGIGDGNRASGDRHRDHDTTQSRRDRLPRPSLEPPVERRPAVRGVSCAEHQEAERHQLEVGGVAAGRPAEGQHREHAVEQWEHPHPGLVAQREAITVELGAGDRDPHQRRDGDRVHDRLRPSQRVAHVATGRRQRDDRRDQRGIRERQHGLCISGEEQETLVERVDGEPCRDGRHDESGGEHERRHGPHGPTRGGHAPADHPQHRRRDPEPLGSGSTIGRDVPDGERRCEQHRRRRGYPRAIHRVFIGMPRMPVEADARPSGHPAQGS